MIQKKNNKTLSQFCLFKTQKWKQRDLVFTFFTRTFDNIFRRLNLGFQSYTPPKIPTIIIKQDEQQSKSILSDFDTIHQFDIITEPVFMDWYNQYSQKNLFDLCMYYWECLIKDYSESDVLLLKCFRNIKKEHLHARISNLEYEDSNQRCNYSYKKIFDTLNQMGTPDDTTYNLSREIIKDKLDMLINEEKDHNSLANYLLGIIFYTLRNQNKKNESLSFLHLLKGCMMGHNDSTFTLGFLYFNGHCVLQD